MTSTGKWTEVEIMLNDIKQTHRQVFHVFSYVDFSVRKKNLKGKRISREVEGESSNGARSSAWVLYADKSNKPNNKKTKTQNYLQSRYIFEILILLLLFSSFWVKGCAKL